MSPSSEDPVEVVGRHRDDLAHIARSIWDGAEVSLHEHGAVEELAGFLRSNGFEIRHPVPELPTAFVATAGKGSPCIGFLGEYDALPALDQRPKATREPEQKTAPGHGCGHNLHGVAGAGAAVALSEALAARVDEGRVAFFGCPAEELLLGKVLMVEAGAFEVADLGLTWHPADFTTPFMRRTNPIISVRFVFSGQATHAGASPEAGASALSPLEQFIAEAERGVEDLRKNHVITEGGVMPNQTPERTSVWWYLRGESWEATRAGLEELEELAVKAANRTGTSVNSRVIAASRSFIANETMSQILWQKMANLGTLDWREDEVQFAKALQDTLDPETVANREDFMPESVTDDLIGHPLASEPIPPFDDEWIGPGSTDLGEVSRVVPTAACYVTTWPFGTPFHSWQAVAASRELGTRGMLRAAQILASTGLELATDHEYLGRVKEEFAEIPDPNGATPAEIMDAPPDSFVDISPNIGSSRT